MTFAIGQPVICIKGNWNLPSGRITRPKFMQMYTVRAYCPCADIPAILLQEIINPEVRFIRTRLKGEASFAEHHFRPLEKIEDTTVVSTKLPAAKWRLLIDPGVK